MASIKKKGATWAVRVSFYDADGKRHFKNKSGFRTKKEAEFYAQKHEMSKMQGDDLLSASKPFSQYFTEWYDTYKSPSVSSSTRDNYSYSLMKITEFFGDTKISDVTRSRYQTFLNTLASNYARETVAKIAGHCRACVLDAIEDGVLQRNFTLRVSVPNCADTERPVKDNYLSVKDMMTLKEYVIPKCSIRNMSAAMVLTSLLTGARYSEVAGLTWSDINAKKNTISINKTLDYKGDGDFLPTKTKSSNRFVSAPPYLFKMLKGLHEDQLAQNINNRLDLVFLGSHSIHVPSDNAVNKLLREAHEKLGIKKVTFHGLRHTHASYLLYKDINIFLISQRLGHSDVGITQRVYMHVIDELKQEQTEKINEALELI